MCPNKLIAEENSVRILYHTDNFLIVDKPYDMLINSNDDTKKPTLQAEISSLLPHLVNPKLGHGFYFTHRLDYITSGVICLALNKEAARVASNAFELRTAKKLYLALLHGHVQQPHIFIDKSIELVLSGINDNANEDRHEMCTSDKNFCKNPRKAFTVLLVLEHGFKNGIEATKVLLFPKSGRRHQLRVHCADIGHPIIGDYVYSDKEETEQYRTFLHSYRLILYNKLENLDIKSIDPFTASDSQNQWEPTDTLKVLDNNILSYIEQLTKQYDNNNAITM